MSPFVARRPSRTQGCARLPSSGLARLALTLALAFASPFFPAPTALAMEDAQPATAAPPGPPTDASADSLPIDWPTALALAGGQGIEIERARLRTAESRALHEQTRARFFPWIEPAVGYRRHEGRLQDVVGEILDTDKQVYDVGAALVAEIDFGKALFENLAARRRLRAAEHASETQRRLSLARAGARYLELARAEGADQVARESVRIAEDYAGQLERAIAIGIAFQGDLQRARVRVERNKQLGSRAQVDRRVAAARLAETLDLDPAIDLRLATPELAVWELFDPHAHTETELLRLALERRPELKGATASLAAAQAEHDAARLGPWLPALAARANFYGLGGGENDALGRFGDGRDYGVGLRWRIGPGGLFDTSRSEGAAARAGLATLDRKEAALRIKTEVVLAFARARALTEQLSMAERMLEAAEETLRLSRERRAFGVGSVLETLAAEEELTRARLDFVGLVAEANAAQLELQRAVGEVPENRSGSDDIPRN